MIKEKIAEHVVCSLVQTGKYHKTSHEASPFLHELVKNVIYRRHFLTSGQMNILKGFSTCNEGLEELGSKVGEQQFVCLLNHFSACPLGIVGNAIYSVHCLKEATSIEPYIIEGVGYSVISLLRERIRKSTNIILVDGKIRGSKEITRALGDGKSIVFYPEGTNSFQLKQGSFKAGRVIFHIAEQGIPIFNAGIYFQNRTFFFQAGEILNTEKIIELGNSSRDKKVSGQAVADLAMRGIARLLPKDLHGFYKI